MPWVFFLLLFLFAATPVRAEISACSASINSSSAHAGATENFVFSITNNDPTNDAQWMKITSPSSNFSVNSGTSNGGWVFLNNPFSSTTLTNYALPPAGTIEATVNVTSVDAESGGQTWEVLMSSDPNGDAYTICYGSLDMNIVPSQAAAISLREIKVTSVSTTSVTINWDTEPAANSQIDYGATIDYGQTSTKDTIATSHSITLQSLTPDTSYHFKLTGSDGNGNSSSTDDLTFTTAAAGTVTTIIITPTPTGAPAPTPTPIPDRTPPTVKIVTNLTKPFFPAPKISGTATDNKAVSKIDYSLNSGKSWLPTDEFTGANTTTATFSFTPKDLEDGNYNILVRSTDSSNNTSTPISSTLVIDRLPPLIGMGIVAFGPQMLSPTASGNITTLAGVPNRIITITSGGPTSVTLTTPTINIGNLEKQPSTDLWINTFTINEPGTYPVTADSIDGAKNKTSRQLFNLEVLPPGKIIASDKSRIKVYVYDTTSQKFILWNGLAYGVNNPQQVDENNNYYLILPAGKYFLEATSPGFKSSRTSIFELQSSTPVNPNFTLNSSKKINLGPITLTLPDFSTDSIIYTPNASPATKISYLVGTTLPKITLQNGSTPIATTELIGKPQVITLLSTWNPNTTSQINYLQSAITRFPLFATVIIPNESPSQVYLFRQRGNYTLPIYSDPDGQLISPLSLFSSPVHLFVNSSGIIEKVIVGLLTPTDLIHNITN